MKNRSTQSDTNMDFNGQAMIPMKQGSAHRGNHFRNTDSNKTIDYGRGPTIGNKSSGSEVAGAGGNPTKAPHKLTIADAEGVSAYKREFAKNPDKINYGQQDRGAGGTTVHKPTNPDRINPERNPYNSTGDTSRGTRSRVAKPANPDKINFGPSSQYNIN